MRPRAYLLALSLVTTLLVASAGGAAASASTGTPGAQLVSDPTARPALARLVLSGTDNPIVLENQYPGTTAWGIRVKVSSDTRNEMKGYANKVSLDKGESIDLKVTVDPAQSFSLAIYRIGWYQGLGGRLMQTVGPLDGTTQPRCPMDPYGMTACQWSTAYTLTIPMTWTSGAYLVKMVNAQGYANWINFTLRDDAGHSDILAQNSVNTWQAYNSWGGKGLYPPGQTHAQKVSFDRPYERLGSRLQSWEINAIRFLEKNGYDVSYTTDLDTHTHPEKILDHKAFLSLGHDEYWTWAMRDGVEAARDAGVNLAFLGGNDSYWQVRYERSASGVANRVMVGYKEQYAQDPYYRSADPAKKRLTTAQWRYSFIGRPEQLMMGSMYARNTGTEDLVFSYSVRHAGNWAYAGTGLVNGASVPYVIGHEYDRYDRSYPKPANRSFVLLSASDDPRSSLTQNSTLYTAPSGALVFNAATTSWPYALDGYGRLGARDASPALQRMTLNILDRFVGRP